MMGVSLRGVEARLLLDGRELARGSGEMLFTHYGVSGPLILTLSGPAVERIGRGRLELSINLRPGLAAEDLDAELRAKLERHGRRTFRSLLKALLPAKMIDVFAHGPASRPASLAARSPLPSGRGCGRCSRISAWRWPATGHWPKQWSLSAGSIPARWTRRRWPHGW